MSGPMYKNGRKKATSTPPLSNSNPGTVICETSIDLAEKFVRKPSHSGNSNRKMTSLSNPWSKPFVLLTDNEKKLLPILKKTKYTSLVPLMKSRTYPKAFFDDLMRKSISICLFPESQDNKEYITFIEDLIKKKEDEFGKQNKAANTILKIKAFLFDGLKSLPRELKGLFPVCLNPNNTTDNFVELLERRPESNLQIIEAALKEIDVAPRQKIILRIGLPGLDDENYMSKSYKLLLDIFEDAGSSPRQYLLQLLHIPNVETLRSESDLEKNKVCIEIQPNSINDYLHFLELCNSYKFQSMVRDKLLVNFQAFIGYINAEIDVQSAIQVLKYFCPDIVICKERVMRKLISDNKLAELVKLVREIPTSDIKHKNGVHSLVTICATTIYKAFLSRSELSPFQYLRYVRGSSGSDFLTHIRTSDGYNALHLAIKHEDKDFMKMLFYSSKWSYLRKDIVRPVYISHQSQHVGYTPRRLAEALSFKDTGSNIMVQFDEYDRYMRYMPELHKACLMGSTEFVSTIVEMDPYLMEEKDEYYANCLFYACASGNDKLVNYLLLKGVPRNVQNRIGESPLHIAAMFGHLEVLNVLSNYFFEIRGNMNKNGYNALCYCAMFGDVDILNFYKEKGFKIDTKALTIAAKRGQNNVFKFLLNETDDVNQGKDNEERLALHYAVMNGNAQAVKELIMKRADITLVDRYKNNVFHLAAENGQKEIMGILITEAKKKGCLEQLISAKNIFAHKDLLIVIRGKDHGRRAWHLVELNRLYVRPFKQAMQSGQVDVARYGEIIKSGFGTNPDRACEKMVNNRLADSLSERKNDMTPLHIAALRNHTELVELLLQSGAPPNDQDCKGVTAMHYAAVNDNVYIMHHLSKARALLDVKTTDGQTPYDVAKDTGSSRAVNVFESSQPIEIVKNFVDAILVYKNKLSLESLQQKRNEGGDMRMYVIEQLRELTLNVNHTLFDLGSGPVQEVSEQ